MVGGAGDDIFVFSLGPSAGVDRIVDFAVGDRIEMSRAAFAGLAAGPLDANMFMIGGAAADASDRIVYDARDGALLFDRDGSGTAFSAQRFATIGAGLAFDASWFLIV